MVIYVLERFLARLEVSEYADRFVLKGGMLLAAWDARRAPVDDVVSFADPVLASKAVGQAIWTAQNAR